MNRLIGSIALAAAVALPVASAANPPRHIPYTGQLERDGVKVSGPIHMVFYLVDDEAKGQGEALWEEAHSNVQIYSGYFTVVLGSQTAIPSSVLARSALYLGTVVDGVAMSGRKRLLPTSYSVETSAVPAGTVMAFAGSVAPDGWLLCDYSAVDSAVYPRLFAAIGETYGDGGDAAGPLFHLPDLRGRMPLGMDNMGGTSADRVTAPTGDQLAGAGGVERTAEVANHTHTTATDGNHRHNLRTSCSGGCFDGNDGMARGASAIDEGTFRTVDNSAETNHSHAVLAGGTGATAQNMPPYLTMNYIVKF